MTQPTTLERHALTELHRLQRKAYGDDPLLADIRRQIAAKTDELLGHLRAAGVDVDALQDQIDNELDNETPEQV